MNFLIKQKITEIFSKTKDPLSIKRIRYKLGKTKRKVVIAILHELIDDKVITKAGPLETGSGKYSLLLYKCISTKN